MRARATAAAALSLLAIAAGCGSDDEGQPIPPRFATALENRLDRIQDSASQGTPEGCQAALDVDPEVQQIIDTMPQDVDAEVRDALTRSFDRLFELIARDCNEQDRAETETETTPTETETT
ncbi:MAG: hypothetical protein JW895_07385, partial [Thermoleophilaceae bacterium]|nr:hypothetical protein [Thermoleophilaceae bacterium]